MISVTESNEKASGALPSYDSLCSLYPRLMVRPPRQFNSIRRPACSSVAIGFRWQ